MTIIDKIDRVLTEKKASKVVFGNDGKFNYAVRVDGVNGEFFKQPFGRQLDDMKKIKEFMGSAKRTHVDCKGVATLASVKKFVKTFKPEQLFAKWTKDSRDYKTDSVEMFYI